MKKLRICIEIQGLAEDEKGNPCPGGVCLTIGDENGAEITGEDYLRTMEQVTMEAVLKAICFDEIFSPSDCRFISPEEYDQLYGDQ